MPDATIPINPFGARRGGQSKRPARGEQGRRFSGHSGAGPGELTPDQALRCWAWQ